MQPLPVSLQANPYATDTESLIREWVSSRSITHGSRILYTRTLRYFFAWTEAAGVALTDITLRHIVAYRDVMQARGVSPLSIKSYLTSVKAFFSWAAANKYYPDVSRGVRPPKVQKDAIRRMPLTLEQTRAFLNYAQTQPPRDRAILTLLAHVGPRTIELSRANVEDLTHDGQSHILYLQRKGLTEKTDFVVITPEAYKPLRDYLASRGRPKGSDPLFTSESRNGSKGARISTRSLSGVTKDALRAIGLDARVYTAHSLRHTAITNLRRAGATWEQAQAVAGHASLVTTQTHYGKISRMEERLRDAPELLLDALYYPTKGNN